MRSELIRRGAQCLREARCLGADVSGKAQVIPLTCISPRRQRQTPYVIQSLCRPRAGDIVCLSPSTRQKTKDVKDALDGRWLTFDWHEPNLIRPIKLSFTGGQVKSVCPAIVSWEVTDTSDGRGSRLVLIELAADYLEMTTEELQGRKWEGLAVAYLT